ncbi:hypothetical protein GQR58_030055 [Nymphon striatum]|nr:hypothetical protein GQR58_030055 [Nymphon striatum]
MVTIGESDHINHGRHIDLTTKCMIGTSKQILMTIIFMVCRVVTLTFMVKLTYITEIEYKAKKKTNYTKIDNNESKMVCFKIHEFMPLLAVGIVPEDDTFEALRRSIHFQVMTWEVIRENWNKRMRNDKSSGILRAPPA